MWGLLGQLEAKAGYWPWIRKAWQTLCTQQKRDENQDAGLGHLLKRWHQEAEEPLDDLTPDEVKLLARYALDSPGIIIGRALRRHWPEAVSSQGFPHTLDLVWNGLRTYLDKRWFVRILGGKERSFPLAIRKAILEGNLESVLDEHFWITSKLYSLQGPFLATNLRESFNLEASNFYLHRLDNKDSKKFSLRCHVAMPFIEARLTSFSGGEDIEKPLHADALRKAFNTPFWPNMLATTSVGQEGLDFHVWCRTVVHWDLCNNPVDIEQREGRIQRFGGLSVRKMIAKCLGGQALENLRDGESPWARLEKLANADEKLSDESGLCPWWVCNGGEIQRHVFKLPNSEEAYRLAWLKENRLLYRLVLGQPNQEDLLAVLASRGDLQPEEVRKALLGLSAWFNS